MLETRPFIRNLLTRGAHRAEAHGHLADNRHVALVNEASNDAERMALGRAASKSLRIVRRRA